MGGYILRRCPLLCTLPPSYRRLRNPLYLRREHKQLVQFCQACGNCRKASTRLSNTLRLVLVPLLYSADAVEPTIVAIHGLNEYCGQTWTGDGCARVMRSTYSRTRRTKWTLACRTGRTVGGNHSSGNKLSVVRSIKPPSCRR